MALAFAPISTRAASAELFGFRVVVHPDNPVTALPTSEVSDLFLGKVGSWAHGPAVRVVDQDLRSPVRSAFTHVIHDRSVESVQQQWQRKVMSGQAQAPLVADSDEAVLDAVRSNQGAVGYVSNDAELAGVRVLPVVEIPERIAYKAPRYSDQARRGSIQGVVVLRLTVDESGEVSEIRVVKDLPMGLTSEAIRAARKWRYEPVVLDDEPLSVSFDVAVRFSLDGAASSR